jgi:hypothetical protein
VTTKKMPNCRLEPGNVGQMTDGDKGAVDPRSLFADYKNQMYILTGARLQPVGAGLVTVYRCDGYHIDVCNVPTDYKWTRPEPGSWPRSFSRVKSVTGARCGVADC